MDDSLRAWMHAELGDDCVVDALRVNGRKKDKGQQVRRVVDPQGTPWVLKEVAVAREWEAEHLAYRDWVPRLGGGAPLLRAADRDLRALLLSAVPGEHPSGARPRTYRDAGALLRRLHDAAAPRPRRKADLAALQDRLHRLLAQAAGVLTSGERSFASEHGQAVAALADGPTVPCHGDYRSHNWLVDSTGTLHVVDFGKARWEQPAWDLAKLFLRPWWQRPRLAVAFLRGYGRGLDRAEADYVEHRMALDALSHAAFGASRGSERHVRFARQRLADLMSGHRVVTDDMLSG